MYMSKPQIIAISGASGSGKTQLVKQLAKAYQCPSLFFDDYVDNNTYPKDMHSWFLRGADASQILTPRFKTKVEALQNSLWGVEFIFIEEPFCRQRASMAGLIDHVILLDTALELCLGRIMKRSLVSQQDSSSAQVIRYLANYEAYFRDIYLHSVNKVRNNCDLVVNGNTTSEVTVNTLSDWLDSKLCLGEIML